MKVSSRLAHLGTRRDPAFGSVSTPIYQTAIFQHQQFGDESDWFYSRHQNPTRQALEEGLAALEGGSRGFAFASGMAAITAVFHLFRPGDHLLVTADLYGHTWRVLDQLFGPMGLTYTFVDTADAAAVAAAFRPETRAVFVETPTNPLLRVADIRALSALCRERGAKLIVDNTFLTPYLQRPLELGAHMVVHSVSKFLAGHNDVIAGAVVVRSPALAEEVGFLQTVTGGILGPQDSWLVLRGVKTLGLRMDRAQANALELARHLQAHPAVARVYYPGLPDHPGAAVQAAQAGGGGAMLSFEVRDPGAVEQVLNRVRLVLFAESLGGTETLITFPWTQTHADIPPAERLRLGLSDRLLRVSVGIEDVGDLKADLDQALPS